MGLCNIILVYYSALLCRNDKFYHVSLGNSAMKFLVAIAKFKFKIIAELTVYVISSAIPAKTKSKISNVR